MTARAQTSRHNGTRTTTRLAMSSKSLDTDFKISNSKKQPNGFKIHEAYFAEQFNDDMPKTEKSLPFENNQSLLRSALVGATSIVLCSLILLTPKDAASMGYFVQSHEFVDPVTKTTKSMVYSPLIGAYTTDGPSASTIAK